MLHLLDQLLLRAAAHEPVALCALVRTRGSTPQKHGAMMLVLRNGQTLGTIGGGCVEAEVRTLALKQIESHPGSLDNPGPPARLHTFHLNHDLGWDDGLICGGAVQVAIQIINSPATAAPIAAARDELAAGLPATLLISGQDEHNELTHFQHTLEPAPRLLIAGAGHVAASLAAIASHLDFQTTVIDDRPDFASASRFPAAACIVGPIDAELARHPITAHTYIVIVTRGHRNDAHALAAVIHSPARYIGLIGSKRKILAIFQSLNEQGVSSELLKKVHAPIGLDIGALTPSEIAISIAAEMIMVRRSSQAAATSIPPVVAASLRWPPIKSTGS